MAAGAERADGTAVIEADPDTSAPLGGVSDKPCVAGVVGGARFSSDGSCEAEGGLCGACFDDFFEHGSHDVSDGRREDAARVGEALVKGFAFGVGDAFDESGFIEDALCCESCVGVGKCEGLYCGSAESKGESGFEGIVDTESLCHLDNAIGCQGIHHANGDGIDGLCECFADTDLSVAVLSVVVLGDPAFSVADDGKISIIDETGGGVLAGLDGGGVKDGFEGRSGRSAGLGGAVEGTLSEIISSDECADKAGVRFKKYDGPLEGGRRGGGRCLCDYLVWWGSVSSMGWA